jgi:hypothetical protein
MSEKLQLLFPGGSTNPTLTSREFAVPTQRSTLIGPHSLIDYETGVTDAQRSEILHAH